MANQSYLRCKNWFSRYSLPLVLGLFVAVAAGVANAQNGSTPLALTPGVPSGSYALSDIDTVNLFNGRVNIHIPLGGDSGRGGAKSSVNLTWDAPVGWHVVTWYGDQGAGPYYYAEQDAAAADAFTTNGVHVGGPYIHSKSAGQGANFCDVGGSGYNYYQYGTTITRLWWVDEGGTEHEMRDRAWEGQPQPTGNCWVNYGPNRGTIWDSVDGSGATYIADAAIRDGFVVGNEYPSGGGEGGWLLLKDGRRYRLGGTNGGLRDRNGNLLTGTKDSLNRDRMLDASGSPSECTSLGAGAIEYCQKFVKKGFNGAQRVLYVAYDSDYRPLYVVLPNNLKYHFYYNSYGDMTRIDLPTGGSVEYTYEPGLSGTQPGYGQVQGGIPGTYGTTIYRRLTERKEFKEGHVLESRQTFSKPENIDSIDQYGGLHLSNAGYVDQKQFDAGYTLLGTERHYFYGSAFSSLGVTGMSSAVWRDGREYRTEIYQGANLLRVSEQNWEQRAPISWWVNGSESSPQKDPRLVDVTTTLENGQTSKVVYGYDPYVPYNSLTDVYEYDYGSGAPGGLLRHTQTTYLKNLNGIDYSASNLQSAGEMHMRDFPAQVSVFDGNNVERSRTSNEYDNYATDTNHHELIPRSDISGLDSGYTTSFITRGNVTGSTNYLLENGSIIGSVSTYTQYDVAGNLVKTIDARGNFAELHYEDHFGAPDADIHGNSAPAELSPAGQPVEKTYAFLTSSTNAKNQTVYALFDYYLGQQVAAEDGTGAAGIEDGRGVISRAYFNDLLDRPTQVIHGANRAAPNKSQSTFAYDDVGRIVTSTSDLNSFNDNLLKSQTLYDGLGRTIETRNYETSTQYIAVATIPFVVLEDPDTGAWLKASHSSNSYRPTLGEQPVWTTGFLDTLGRVTKVRTPDTALVRTYYDGARTLVVDQMGKERLSVSTALGQLKEVWEITPADSETETVSFPGRAEVTAGYRTTYEYDTLNHLTLVTQGPSGTQAARHFTYDSLGRLISAINPENGTVTSQYDQNGNVIVKTDARGVSTHFSYDELNRPVRRWYNASSSQDQLTNNNPALPGEVGVSDEVRYFYDAQSLPAGAPSFARGPSTGRLVASIYGTGSSGDYYGFDAGGASVLKIQQTGGVNYQTTAAHNVSGKITSLVYPSLHTVSYNFDGNGRTANFSGNLGDGAQRDYSVDIKYAALGGMSQEQFGTSTAIYNKLFYNVRGQLSEIREGTSPNNSNWERGAVINFYSACWGMCAGQPMPDNNGNVKRQEYWVQDGSGNVLAINSQAFDYDSLNRLKQVYEGSASQPTWKQAFVYDRYGNRRVDVNNTTASLAPRAFELQTSSNRLLAPGDTNLSEPNRRMRYDPAGNLTTDNYTGAGQRTYDAENHMTAGTGVVSATYSYDGNGQRVRRNLGGVETWQVLGLNGELLAEYPANAAATAPEKEYGYRNGHLLVTAGSGAAPAPPPSSLAATPSSGGGNVSLSWSAASGANKYRLERKGAGGAFVLAGTTASTSLIDTGVAAGSAYLYRVCAANAQGVCTSVFSNVALGAAVSFPTDPTITSSAEDPTGVSVTKVKAAHITELRTAVNAVRTLAGLPAGEWTHQAITPSVSFVYAEDVRDLRLELHEALVELNIQTSDYEDQTLNGAPTGTAIKKIHITQLRQRATSGLGGAGGSSLIQFGVQWLVTDQLGTPRMVFDSTGNLASVKRHDYLPFGEDLAAGARSTTPGYGTPDGVRQKFTGYEHDDETGLEYAKARYYSSTQGRFTGVDPLTGEIKDPQSWNRYAYVGNNPANLVDPTGMNYFVGGGVNEPGITEYRIDGFDMGPEGTNSQLTSETMMGISGQMPDRYWYGGGQRVKKPKPRTTEPTGYGQVTYLDRTVVEHHCDMYAEPGHRLIDSQLDGIVTDITTALVAYSAEPTAREVTSQQPAYGLFKGDDRGHIIGYALGGPPIPRNLFSQHPSMNRGPYRVMETNIRKELTKHKDWVALIKVTLVYNSPQLGPACVQNLGNKEQYFRPMGEQYSVEYRDTKGRSVGTPVSQWFSN